MGIGIVKLHHVNVVVRKELEDTTKHFYSVVLGLKETPKPLESQARGGAWYQLGEVQLHLSVRKDGKESEKTAGHVCYTVADVQAAESHFRAAGVEIIADDQPVAGQPRFYVRDPGHNLIEIAQRN